MQARSPAIRSGHEKRRGRSHYRTALVADPFSIRPPPLPGIFGVPGSGSLIAKEPREVIRQAHADQSAGDFGEAEAEMMGDILEEDEGWFDLFDDPGDMRPEMARIVRTPALAR